MKSLAQTIQATKPDYKHLLLLSFLFLPLPTGIIHATSVKQETYETQKTNINNDLDDQKEPGETSIEGIDTGKNINNDLDDQKEPGETSIENTKEEKKQDKSSFEVEKLKGFIKTTIEKVEHPETLHKLQNNEMVYFYGNTGSGKSTIINYLLGNELEKYYPEDEIKVPQHSGRPNNIHYQSDDESEETIYIEDSDDEEDTNFQLRRKNPKAIGPKIGQNAVKAETTYPCPYFSQNQQLGYCDTAGFSDTRGIENIVCSYIGNNLIIQKSNKLKAVCFVTSKEELNISKGQPFLDSVITTIDNLVKKTKDCEPLDSIFVLLNNKSQIKNSKLVKQVFIKLKKFKKDFKENQQNTQKHQSYINILSKILKDSARKETMRILAINPLDDGESRKEFLKRISTSPIIPKKNLKRLSSKQGEKEVRYLQEKMLKETNPILDRILALKKTINDKIKKASELTIQIQNLNKEKENFEKAINKLQIELQQIEKEQQKLHRKIIKSNKDKEEIQKQIDSLQSQKDTAFDYKKVVEKFLSQCDHMIKNQKERIAELKYEQREIKSEIKRLQHKIEEKNHEIGQLNLQIEKETKQIEEFKNEKNILLENITQDRIVALAEDDKNWFDYYQKWLDPVSKYWSSTKLEQKVFDGLSKHIYNALKACNTSCITLQGHTDWISSVHFNHNGSLIASASGDQTIRIWDTNTWKCKNTLQGHIYWVFSVHFNHNGSLLASASGDKTIRIWDTNTWKCKNTLQGHTDTVRSVHFNPNGSLLASASKDKTIRIWDTNTWKCKNTLKGHTSSVFSVHFNHNGSLIASASNDRTIRIWDTNTWQCKNTLKGHTWGVFSVHFNHNGSLLASASWDETIRIWDTNTWKCKNTLQGHTDWVNSLHFNHNGSLIASASQDQTIRIWDTNTWKCKNTLQGHTSSIRSVDFNHNGSLLASASEDQTIRIWDIPTLLGGDTSKYHIPLLDRDQFKLQTDKHLKKITQVIKHYYVSKTKDLTESKSQKKVKDLKKNITFFTEQFSIQAKTQLDIERQINDSYNKIDTLETKKLEKIEEQMKKKQTNYDIQHKLPELIQKKKDVDSIIQQLKQSSTQKQEDLNNISTQLLQVKNKHEYLLKEMKIIQGNHEDVSFELKKEEQDLVAYQGMLERKQPEIDLILKIDSIVPMGLIAYSFIKKYMQCKTNNKHM